MILPIVGIAWSYLRAATYTSVPYKFYLSEENDRMSTEKAWDKETKSILV